MRPARLADVDAIAQVERASWPPGMAADAATITARIAAFSEGQWVAERDGCLVAYAAAQRITTAWLSQSPLSFAVLTDNGRFTNSHAPTGDIYQLVGVAVLPEQRGTGVARALVDRQIAQARATPGILRIVGFTRPAGYHRHATLSLVEYIALQTKQGQPLDPVLAFHLNAGAKLRSLHAAFRPEDHEAGGCGVLIEYDVA